MNVLNIDTPRKATYWFLRMASAHDISEESAQAMWEHSEVYRQALTGELYIAIELAEDQGSRTRLINILKAVTGIVYGQPPEKKDVK